NYTEYKYIHYFPTRRSSDLKLATIVNKEMRMASARNHSATHILHKVLKEVLGEHVNQAGSLVTPERLRFDVTHFEAITKEELKVDRKSTRLNSSHVSISYAV